MKRHKTMTREELEKFFQDDISGYQFDWNEETTKNEEETAELLEEILKIKLKRFPKVDEPVSINTPDYASPKNEIAVEIKSPSSYRHGIEESLRKSLKQMKLLANDIKCITVIKIDKILEEKTEDEIMDEILHRAFSLQITYLFIFREEKLLRVVHMLKKSKK